MTEVTNSHRSPARGSTKRGFSLRAFFVFLILLIGHAPAASAEFDAEECMQVWDEFAAQLSRKFRSTDKKGLAERRKSANDLLESVSSPCAHMFLYRFDKEVKHGGPIGELLVEKLANETVIQFIDILDRRACCGENDIENWGRKFETDNERISYTKDYFDGYFDERDTYDTRNQSADPDVECMHRKDRVMEQLSRKFTRSDKKGLADRRKKLNTLFETTSRECAYLLSYWLRNEKHGNEALQELFYGKLARPTREQLLDILKSRIRQFDIEEAGDATSNTISNNAAKRKETYI